jgi:hypothetical protein
MQHAHTHEIRNPGPLVVPGALTAVLLLCAAVGVAAFIIGLVTDADRIWYSFIVNHFFFMSLALGGLFFAAIQWLTGAMWSAPVRRIAEATTAYIPLAIVTMIILYFGVHHIYAWSHPEIVKGDIVLEGKEHWLSAGWFVGRNIFILLVLLYFSRKMIGNSLAQDHDKSNLHSVRNARIAAPFMLVFAVGYTIMSFDQLMSIDPHWFSTIFGVYCFAGLFYSILACTTILTVWLKRRGALGDIVNDNHLHDLGKFMFAFTIFWAYIGFAQFLLYWYANMPEEAGWFIHRLHGGWFWISAFLLLCKFGVPFFLLMPRDAKRNETMLVGVGWFMLIAQWIDFWWVAQPQLYTEGPRIGWQEILLAIGFAGVFGLMVVRFLSRHNVVAIGDPRLPEAMFDHHQ